MVTFDLAGMKMLSTELFFLYFFIPLYLPVFALGQRKSDIRKWISTVGFFDQ